MLWNAEKRWITPMMVFSRCRMLFPETFGTKPMSHNQLAKAALTAGDYLSKSEVDQLWESLQNYERDMRVVGGFEDGI